MASAELSETMDGPTIQWMKKQSRAMQAAIAGSLIIEDQGRFYNRLVWVDPDQDVPFCYNKKHLFSLAGEPHHYQAGTEKLTLSYRGWTIATHICYDLRFPVWSRNTEGADLMIYVANFPQKRERAWNGLLPARAIENQCYVAGVNRVGTDGNGIYHQGDSAIYDYEGQCILNLGQTEKWAGWSLDRTRLQAFRRAYPFWKDADPFVFLPAKEPKDKI